MSTNMVVPAAPAGRASDDEILGLSTNTARKSGRNNLAKIAEGAQANTVSLRVWMLFLRTWESRQARATN
jgi:hypothetical protein